MTDTDHPAMLHHDVRRSMVIGLCLSLVCLLSTAASLAQAAENAPTPEQLKFFETKIRPLLAKHCYECHGADEQSSDLRMDTWGGMLRGGKAGTILVPGHPEQSLLITAVGYQDSELQMPPDKKLSAREIKDLTVWVASGAAHPDAGSTPSVKPSSKVDLEAGRQFWSFQPIVKSPLPEVQQQDWVRTPIDHFILADLEAKGIEPSPPAEKRLLLRRATFDLTGLPPTPEEVEAFLNDESPQAFARVVDRLLESPHYGERWGRHWLDVARYADSNGLDENIAYGNAWRYRDYVVAAFNKDKPFDQFVIEQLAGDLLPATDDVAVQHERAIATGFLSLGPKVLAEVDETKMEMDIVDEQVDTVGRAFLAMTLGCARCHDHKFDPLPTSDYYAMVGIFKSTRTMEHFTKIARWNETPLNTPETLAKQAEYEQTVKLQKDAIQQAVEAANAKLVESSEADFKLPEKPETLYPAETKEKLKQLRDELAKLEKAVPVVPTAMGVTDGTIADVAVHVRGSHLTLGEIVPRRFPQVIAGSEQPPLSDETSGRLELANWLVGADHPLTSRVMVNRIWRWHFGQGLSRSTDNFGRLGERPTNPELLDWLAREFIESGWSIKQMHRTLMLSSTYRQSSDFNAKSAEIDPENRLWWRFPILRLEAEVIRDTLLSVSGLLDTTPGGSLLHVGNREFLFNHTSEDGTKYDSHKRALYLPVVRNHLYDVFQLFDYSDASVLNSNRSTTVVAPQALFMLNSELVAEVCENLARQISSDSNLDDAQRVRQLYLKAYGRPASDREIDEARELLNEVTVALESSDADVESRRVLAWSSVCQVVIAANEFIYIR